MTGIAVSRSRPAGYFSNHGRGGESANFMIFGPDFSSLAISFVLTTPFAFLLFMCGFWLGNKTVDAHRSKTRNAFAVLVQWCIVIPLQFVLGHQLSRWSPGASEAVWIATLMSAVPLAGIAAAYYVLRHRPKQAILVGVVSSVVGMVTSVAVLGTALKYG
jgi:uncharacterized membrane protein HdeD (DUF308 family)